tara:strand:+ start:70 stop:570 length:501 start_codon:yes stop_codon:yes gene_type:complete
MDKVSVLFVCLGNICRSPAAEAIFQNLINDKGIGDQFIVDSAGTGSWHVGKKADSRMRFAAKQRNINITSNARQIREDDFRKFKYILVMDNSNFHNVIDLKSRVKGSDFAEILKIQDFSSKFTEKEVPDPYFGGDTGFDHVLDILEDSVFCFLENITQSKDIIPLE